MSRSKWPTLSFENPENWSQHATTLQSDFYALQKYLESNQNKGVPKYLFNILYASYSSLNTKLTQAMTPVIGAIKHRGNEMQENYLLGAVMERAAPPQDKSEASNYSGHKSGIGDQAASPKQSGSQNQSQGQIDVGGVDGATQELKEIRSITAESESESKSESESESESKTETETSSAEVLSDGAETTVSDAANAKEPDTLFNFCIPVNDPCHVNRFRKMSSADIRLKCIGAIRSVDIVSTDVNLGTLVLKAYQLANGSVQVFIQSESLFLTLTHHTSWRRLFLTGADKYPKPYGVVTAVVRNAKTAVVALKDHDAQKKTQLASLVDENKPRLTALQEHQDITSMTWLFRKSKAAPSYLLINFMSPELANQVIKRGFAWAGENHECRRYVEEWETEPCGRCLAYGHHEAHCKARPRCCKCGGVHASSTCLSKLSICPSCSVEHPVIFRCQKRLAEKRKFEHAIGQQKPYWGVDGKPNSNDFAGIVCRNHPSKRILANEISAEGGSRKAGDYDSGTSESGSTATASDEQTDSSTSDEDSVIESEHRFRNIKRMKQISIQSNSVPVLPDTPTNSKHAKPTCRSETKTEVNQGDECPVRAVVKPLLSDEDTGSLSSEDTSESGPECGDKQEERSNRRPVPMDAGSTASRKESSLLRLKKAPGPELEPKTSAQNTVDQGIATNLAELAAPNEQAASSEPIRTSPPAQEVRDAGYQIQPNVSLDATLIAPEQQIQSSDPTRNCQREPEPEVRREEYHSQNPRLADAVANSPGKPTQISDLRRPSLSEPERKFRHEESKNGHTPQTDAPASRPPATASSEVDLDSTPLPDDAEAIIRQLERLKAIVLARSKVDGGSNHQIAGVKRKASEPLGAASEKKRIQPPILSGRCIS